MALEGILLKTQYASVRVDIFSIVETTQEHATKIGCPIRSITKSPSFRSDSSCESNDSSHRDYVRMI